MRDLEFFPTHAEYEDHIWQTVFTEPWVKATPFYRNLVNFIMDHRAPIFYTVSDASEHFAFSGAYYFETRRQRYPSRTREQLFWLHDFTHMLFPYAHDVWDTTGRQFLEQFWYQERIASSETEIMAYYRVPGLRERVFQDETLWYDVIKDEGWAKPYPGAQGALNEKRGMPWPRYRGDSKPDAEEFLKYRIRVQMEDEFGEKELGHNPAILKFITQWRRLTPKWVNKRYASVAGLRIDAADYYPYNQDFSVRDYEQKIMGYALYRRGDTEVRQERYEHLIMANVCMAYDLLEWPSKPTRWRHIPEAIDRLEGAVLLP